MMGIAIPYTYLLEKPEEGPSVHIPRYGYRTSNSMEIEGLKLPPRGIESLLRGVRGTGTAGSSQAIIE